MTADRFLPHMPPHVKPEFLAWLAHRDSQTGLRGFRQGYDHGWHDGQANNQPILRRK